MPFMVRLQSHLFASSFHSYYEGLGAFVSPWVATEFSKRERWSHFYLVSLGVAVTNTIFLAIVFRGQHQKGAQIRFLLNYGMLIATQHVSLRLVRLLKITQKKHPATSLWQS